MVKNKTVVTKIELSNEGAVALIEYLMLNDPTKTLEALSIHVCGMDMSIHNVNVISTSKGFVLELEQLAS
jgi:hypothetical protein